MTVQKWEAYNLRSNIFEKNGELQKALNDLNKSYLINDNEATTLISRGQLKIKLGDINGACQDLTKVSEWGFDQYQSWINNNCK